MIWWISHSSYSKAGNRVISENLLINCPHMPAGLTCLPPPPRMVFVGAVIVGFYEWTPPLMLILFVWMPLLALVVSKSMFALSELTFGRLFKTSMPPFFWMKVDRVRNLCLNSETYSRVTFKSLSRLLFFWLLRLSFFWRTAISFFIFSWLVERWWYISLSWSRFFSLLMSLFNVFWKLSPRSSIPIYFCF